MDPLEELTQAIDNFPTLPDVAMRVGEELDSDDCNMNKVVRLQWRKTVPGARLECQTYSPQSGGHPLPTLPARESAPHPVCRLSQW